MKIARFPPPGAGSLMQDFNRRCARRWSILAARRNAHAAARLAIAEKINPPLVPVYSCHRPLGDRAFSFGRTKQGVRQERRSMNTSRIQEPLRIPPNGARRRFSNFAGGAARTGICHQVPISDTWRSGMDRQAEDDGRQEDRHLRGRLSGFSGSETDIRIPPWSTALAVLAGAAGRPNRGEAGDARPALWSDAGCRNGSASSLKGQASREGVTATVLVLTVTNRCLRKHGPRGPENSWNFFGPWGGYLSVADKSETIGNMAPRKYGQKRPPAAFCPVRCRKPSINLPNLGPQVLTPASRPGSLPTPMRRAFFFPPRQNSARSRCSRKR